MKKWNAAEIVELNIAETSWWPFYPGYKPGSNNNHNNRPGGNNNHNNRPGGNNNHNNRPGGNNNVGDTEDDFTDNLSA